MQSGGGLGFATEWGVNLLALILATISLLIWVVLTFLRGAFWQVLAFDDDTAKKESLERWPRVAAVVPARNEAEFIARTVESLAKQEYAGELRVAVGDDHSEDGTRSLARGAAARAGGSERVLILQGAALESGWTGQLLAMKQGVESSVAQEADYFWFTDADIEHAPDTLRRLVQRPKKDNLDLVSLMVLAQVNSLPERLLIPPFLYFFLKLYPPSCTADRRWQTAGAAGGCLFLKRAGLEGLGGVAGLRGVVIFAWQMWRAVRCTRRG